MHSKELFIAICCCLGIHGLLFSQPTWHTQTSPVTDDLVTVSFASITSGWAATNNGKIIYTSNGGWDWTLQMTLEDRYPEKIAFTDTLTGWMAVNTAGPSETDSAMIMNTTNGGADWVINHKLPNAKFYDIFFLNDTMGWAVGYYLDPDTIGLRLHTIDGGQNWMLQEGVNVAMIYTSVSFRDTASGSICGPGPILMLTNNGGRRPPEWAMDIKQITQPVYDMVNIGDVYGCMVGAEGKILFTRDKWANFFLDYDYEGGDTLWSIDGIELPAFWIVGEAGTILYAGVSFIGPVIQDQSLDMSQNLFEVDVLDASHVWVVGQSGTILFYGEGNQGPGAVPIVTRESFSLYPNPSSGTLMLKRSTEEADVISIYNLQGVLIKSQPCREGEKIIPVPLDGLEPGQYIFELGTNRERLVLL